MAWRLAHRVAVPGGLPRVGVGWSADGADRATSKDCAAVTCWAVTLSNENALSRSGCPPFPRTRRPAGPSGPLTAAHGQV
jgi:hypothetical protein